MSPKKDWYLSIDIEADGRIPGQNSMLQFGVAIFDPDGEDPRKPLATFEANLGLLPDAVQDPATMAWWKTQGDAYENTRIEAIPPDIVMPQFVAWCNGLKKKARLTLVGYPIAFDFLWLYWYMIRFGRIPSGDTGPFGFSGIDIKTMAAARLGLPYRQATKRNMPKRWFEGAPEHTHDGLDDAIGQGILFVNMMNEPITRTSL